jgi:uncharacterized protein
MNLGHLERLRRARDLLAVKGYETEQTRLTCYSGARFDSELVGRAADDPMIHLVGLSASGVRHIRSGPGFWLATGLT